MLENKPNVLQLISNLDRAGAQEVVRTLVEYLIDDCNPVVCTLKDGPLRQDIEALGIPVKVLSPRRYPIIALPWFVADINQIRQELVEVIKQYQIDIVQTHLLGILDFLILTLKYNTDLKGVLWTVHNVDFLPLQKQTILGWQPKRFAHALLYRLTVPKVSGFIAVSEEVHKAMIQQLGFLQNKIVTIDNGVDTKRYQRVGHKIKLCNQLGINPDNTYLAIAVGRLTKQKGHTYLIDAARPVVDRYPNTHFLIVGEGELKDELQAQVNRLGLATNLHFLGNRSDVPDLLAATDLFILPSLWEGLAMALLEAMSAGKPIIATSVSGTNQVMVANETGFIVAPGNSQALHEAIISILSTPTKALAMGQTAKNHVEIHYSAQTQAKKHLALYHQLLSNTE